MTDTPQTDRSPWAVFWIFLRLGLTSFGGPIAHLGYFRQELVVRRQWLTERSYADLVALCQFLPGPASSQVGIALGLSRSGYAGALAAWAGFTLPSAVVLMLFAQGITHYGDALPTGVLHGLKVVAVAVVAQAVWGMARNLCPDVPRITTMVAATCAVLLVPSVWVQVGVMALAAAVGLRWCKPPPGQAHDPLPMAIGPRAGAFWLALFFAAFVGFSATQMLLDKKPAPTRTLPGPAGLLGSGGVIGFLSGLVGAGGGFVSVPFMTWCNVPMHQAVATSAALGFPIALANVVGYVVAGQSVSGLPAGSVGYVFVPALAVIATASVLMAPLGVKAAHALPVKQLKRVFALILYALAAYMLYRGLSA